MRSVLKFRSDPRRVAFCSMLPAASMARIRSAYVPAVSFNFFRASVQVLVPVAGR
jgi:hypothetical protein